MTSQINYLSINENFPVPGEDNDTQVFRDNFDTIKNSLRLAQEEVTDLQNNAARLNESNNFGNNDLSGAVFVNNMDKKFDGGRIDSGTATLTIDYENGNYQIFRINTDSLNIEFQNLPTNANPALAMGVGKITLEIYGDVSGRTLNFLNPNGLTLKKSPNWPTSVVADSDENPLIIEAWQHDQNNIFMNYLGKFS
jgi:hypothetical protein